MDSKVQNLNSPEELSQEVSSTLGCECVAGDTLNLSFDLSKKAQKGEWALTNRLRSINEREIQSGLKRRELGVTWRNLTVEVKGSDSSTNHNFFSQFNLLHELRLIRYKPVNKTILNNSYGCVKPGEMLLVLGRPGVGCTTLLKLLANRRYGYALVNGSVKFGTMEYTEAAKYRG